MSAITIVQYRFKKTYFKVSFWHSSSSRPFFDMKTIYELLHEHIFSRYKLKSIIFLKIQKLIGVHFAPLIWYVSFSGLSISELRLNSAELK